MAMGNSAGAGIVGNELPLPVQPQNNGNAFGTIGNAVQQGVNNVGTAFSDAFAKAGMVMPPVNNATNAAGQPTGMHPLAPQNPPVTNDTNATNAAGQPTGMHPLAPQPLQNPSFGNPNGVDYVPNAAGNPQQQPNVMHPTAPQQPVQQPINPTVAPTGIDYTPQPSVQPNGIDYTPGMPQNPQNGYMAGQQQVQGLDNNPYNVQFGEVAGNPFNPVSGAGNSAWK